MEQEVSLSFIFQTIAVILAVSFIAVALIKIRTKKLKDK